MSNQENQTALAAPTPPMKVPPISLEELVQGFYQLALDKRLDEPTQRLAARFCTALQWQQVTMARLSIVRVEVVSGKTQQKELSDKLDALIKRFDEFENSVVDVLTQLTQMANGQPGAAAGAGPQAPQGIPDDGPVAGPPPPDDGPVAGPPRPPAAGPVIEDPSALPAPQDPAAAEVVRRLKRGAADDARVEALARTAPLPAAAIAPVGGPPALPAAPPAAGAPAAVGGSSKAKRAGGGS